MKSHIKELTPREKVIIACDWHETNPGFSTDEVSKRFGLSQDEIEKELEKRNDGHIQ